MRTRPWGAAIAAASLIAAAAGAARVPWREAPAALASVAGTLAATAREMSWRAAFAVATVRSFVQDRAGSLDGAALALLGSLGLVALAAIAAAIVLAARGRRSARERVRGWVARRRSVEWIARREGLAQDMVRALAAPRVGPRAARR